MVLLLPHGYEGQGPEHSSARLERWLQSCSENNMAIVNITTPANFFHALRRQLAWKFRIPLVVMSPKSLLRHPACISAKEDFSSKTKFKEIIDDDTIKLASKVSKVILCSGKIYYDLEQYRNANNISNVAIIRLEQLYPFPTLQINKIIQKYKGAKMIWVQEEPLNMGAASFIQIKIGASIKEIVARPEAASPATGFKKVHDREQAQLMTEAFA
jgi:2-oxoglutarate dehydrogenase E1 component